MGSSLLPRHQPLTVSEVAQVWQVRPATVVSCQDILLPCHPGDPENQSTALSTLLCSLFLKGYTPLEIYSQATRFLGWPLHHTYPLLFLLSAEAPVKGNVFSGGCVQQPGSDPVRTSVLSVLFR